MPYVKPIPGHTSTRGIQSYLEKKNRALAHDYQNIDAPMSDLDKDGNPIYKAYDWARTMDVTRSAFENDTSWKGKKARTWMHYVLSPSPEDNIDLATLRELSRRWVERSFPDHEVAIVYHDDNEHHIPHAHIVVNNTNLETGRRLQVPNPRDLTSLAQTIAKEMQLDYFKDDPEDVFHNKEAVASRRKAIDRSEQELSSRSEYSWVADIRARIDVARGISKTPVEFQTNLRTMGISVREATTRKGDWVYTLVDTPSRQVTGSRLGATYAKSYVTSELSTAVPTPLLDDKAAIQSIAGRAIEVSDLSELTHLAEAVHTVSQGGFKSLAGLDAAISRVRQDGKHPATLARLMRVRSYCEAHKMLPKYPARERPVLRREFERRSDYHPVDIPERARGHEMEQARPAPSPERPQGRDR